MESSTNSCSDELDRIIASDAPDMDKLARAFDCVTAFTIGDADREVELYQAMRDRESVVKTQIKMESFKHARSIFEHCYLRVTGERPWPAGGSMRDEG